MSKNEVVEFLRGKALKSDDEATAREDAAKTWRGGTEESWKAACALHPATAGRSIGKAARLREAETHARIAAKLRREAELYREAVRLLEAA